MPKFYRKDIGKRRKEFYQVYDEIPDSAPEVFKKCKLIAYDKCSISCNPLAPVNYEVHWSEHSMTWQDNIDQMFRYQSIEITKEEFDNAMKIIKNLAKDIKEIYNKL